MRWDEWKKTGDGCQRERKRGRESETEGALAAEEYLLRDDGRRRDNQQNQ